MTPQARIPSIVLSGASDEPVYLQIARSIRDRIGSGAVRPGAQLPPVRSLASDLGVNLNTVARAYRVLEEEGFVQIRNRSGAVVAPPPVAPASDRENRLRASFKELLLHMRQTGLSRAAVRRLVDEEIALSFDRRIANDHGRSR